MELKIFLIASLAESLLNFRHQLLLDLLASGYEVHVVAPFSIADRNIQEKLCELGIHVHSIDLQRTGLNPLKDALSFFQLWRIFRQIEPDKALAYTIKPVIYGTLAAALASVPERYAMITGLGYAFSGEKNERNSVHQLVKLLYRLALKFANTVIFQNPDDERLFKELSILSEDKSTVIVNGSGVDTDYFSPCPLPENGVNFLLIARLLGDKGVREYVVAARAIKNSYPNVRFRLVGWIDENPNAITQNELDEWISDGVIDYLGRMSDVRVAIAESSVYVLPSYREGTPRTVLEAMSMGRAIITTDTPGCRETVIDGENGFLVPVKSVDALVKVMEYFLKDQSLVEYMGNRSREIVEEKYDVHKVNRMVMNALLIS